MATKQEKTQAEQMEKNIELLFKGINELKESQKKTDEQMRGTDAKLDRVEKLL